MTRSLEPPPMAPLTITHCFTVFRSLGGVESVLRHHHQHDAWFGLDSRFVIYFEPAAAPLERVDFLGLSGRSSIRQIRVRTAAALAKRPSEIVIYHGMWGMNYLAGGDGARRRFLMLHGATPGMEGQLTACGQWVDGILCVSRPLIQTVQQCVPHLDAARVALLPYPVAAPVAGSPAPPAPPPRRLVLGFCGRLTREQKRIDRLPVLFAQLDAAGLDYRVEFLGDGAERGWLAARCPDPNRFQFHGRRSGDDYWRIVRSWDVIVFVSDYEGTPISMLEALSQGVLPIYPKIGSGGEPYAEAVRAGLVYEPDDFQHVARTLREIRDLAPAELEVLRQRCRDAVKHHLGDSYLERFARFIRGTAGLPPVAGHEFPVRSFPIDRIPLAMLEALRRLGQRRV